MQIAHGYLMAGSLANSIAVLLIDTNLNLTRGIMWFY